ncbi:DUF2182 domain-containing protein [Roseibium denhamense]|uniref:Predicted metal-binding membrane protein n=1 Tax=Roseibium denhamense TaxID=76305 RepID=A0ABY1NR41_9HYPH|nr:DUF2182 domain-containing protein [Roseibium denhamense]MTI07963.1 DUF2182 domain-containing protein [Roseibium denhamense]SMP15214.1 Predicted metal-binding membrane protein [Roseibium denhamense]
MSIDTSRHQGFQTERIGVSRQPDPAWRITLGAVGVLAFTGWAYLAAMVIDMIPVMDMSEAGPGMGLLNQFNFFRGLPEEARAALAVLCLPAGATFGMPSEALTAGDFLKIYMMWAMMALAMMLPSAVPMLRAFHKQHQNGLAARSLTIVTLLAAVGYLSVWFGYAAIATIMQWGLVSAGAISPMMAPVSMALTVTVLLVAGFYQFSPQKRACLDRCWYPKWVFDRPSKEHPQTAAIAEGWRQGLYCLGCCWAVMAVMFAVGLMNIFWIAALGGLMALEKSLITQWFPRFIGLFFLVWGSALLFALTRAGGGG